MTTDPKPNIVNEGSESSEELNDETLNCGQDGV